MKKSKAILQLLLLFIILFSMCINAYNHIVLGTEPTISEIYYLTLITSSFLIIKD